MSSGSYIIYKCPTCDGLIKQRIIPCAITGFGPKWTDGRTYYPMLPSAGSLLKCPHCSVLLWHKQLIKLGEIDFSFGRKSRLYNKPWYGWFGFDDSHCEGRPEDEPDISSALYESEPSLKEYLDYVSLGVDNAEKERYLRLQVWWNANDARRASKAGVPMEPDEIGNLERLATLMDERDDDDRLLKGEIMRELGRFSEAEAILAKRFPRRLRHASELIRALNEARDTKVAEIVPPQPVPDDYSDAPAKLFPPLLTTITPSAGPVRPNGRGHPLVIIDARTRKNLFKKVSSYHRLGRFGYLFRDALTYIPLHPLAEDSWDDYKHRLDLLLTLLDVALYRTANKTRAESTAKLHQLHENAILQLRDDIRDGVIELDRLNTEANAELFTSRGVEGGSRALITTREIVGRERRKYRPLVSHPAAYCIVWLAHRLLPHWEETVLSENFSSSDGSSYVEIIAGIASRFLTESSAGDAEKAADEFDRRAWCCYVIDRLLLKMKGLDKDSSSSMDDLEFDWTSPFE